MRISHCLAEQIRSTLRRPTMFALGVTLLVALSACSSGSNNDDGGDTDLNPPANVPVLPSTNPPVDTSPIDLLIGEIKQVAAMPVITISNKLASGETLSAQEQTCIQAFDISLGEQLNTVSCDSRWYPGDTVLSISSASFEQSQSCDQSLATGNVRDCSLLSTRLGFDVEWVTTTNEPGPNSPIGTIQPIAGTRIDYNLDDNGKLTLTEATPVTGTFNCVIDILSASLLTDQSTGNCESEMGRTVSRLYELRTGG